MAMNGVKTEDCEELIALTSSVASGITDALETLQKKAKEVFAPGAILDDCNLLDDCEQGLRDMTEAVTANTDQLTALTQVIKAACERWGVRLPQMHKKATEASDELSAFAKKQKTAAKGE